MVDEPVHPGRLLALLTAGRARPVFEHGSRTVGAEELLDLIGRTAAGLRRHGIGPGDGVAVAVGVSPEAFAAIVAAYLVGARVAGVRPGLTEAQRRHLLDQRISAVLLDAGTAADLRPADLPRAGVAVPLGVGPVDGLPDLTATAYDGALPPPAGRPTDIGRIIYTSGSTGAPKGCAQTYAALTASWTPRPDRWPPAIRDLAAGLERYLLFGSLSSQVMMEYGVLTIAAGGTLVVADPPPGAAGPARPSSRDTWRPRAFVPEAIARHRASASVVTVPRLYQLVRQQRQRPVPLDSLRALLVSGSPLDPGRLTEALETLGGVVYHGYGQSETGMISMVTPAELIRSSAALATVGRPPSAVDVEVRGPDGAPVPPGTEGELYVRTPVQAASYWADPTESAEVFVDGWVRTRDLGHLDADGYLHLTGRTREIIIINATVFHPGPIERALAEDPTVAEAYVVGAPDEETGEAAHAFVVPADGRSPDTDALRSLVGLRCGAACVPRSITVIDEVPVAPSGKPDKRALASMVHAAVPVR